MLKDHDLNQISFSELGDNNFDHLHDLFHSHGISAEDRNWILTLYANPEMRFEPSLLSYLAHVFEVTPEWITGSHKIPVFVRHYNTCIQSWVMKLMAYKQQALHPKIIFIQELDKEQEKEQDNPSHPSQDPQTLVFIELTKKIKTNMAWRVLRNEEPPSWQQALWLVENAGLFFQILQLESVAYQRLWEQSILPIQALAKGKYWPIQKLKFDKKSLSLASNTLETESLSFYAEKLRYTMPMATPILKA